MVTEKIEALVPVSKELFYKAVTDYEAYADFVDNVKGVKVVSKTPLTIEYSLSIFKDFTYTLLHTEDPVLGKVMWKLKDSDLFSENNGAWTITGKDEGSSHVTYEIQVGFKVPVPGFILKKLVKGNLPALIKSFEKRAKSYV